MNIYKSSENKGYKLIMAVVLIVVLLTSSILVGSVLAWLEDREDFDDGGNIHIGSVDFDIYNGSTLITSTKNNAEGITPTDLTTATSNEVVVEGDDTTAIRDLSITIRNTGTVTAIMRVTLTVKYEDDSGNKQQCLLAGDDKTSDTMLFNQIRITNTGWVNDFSANNAVAAGYTYYDSQIKPYTIRSVNGTGEVVSQDVSANAVTLMSQILVPNSMKTRKYYISITVEGVAHSGNIYQEIADRDDGNPDTGYQIPVEAYPFGNIDHLITGDPPKWSAWKKTN